jgi:hypothetical protein
MPPTTATQIKPPPLPEEVVRNRRSARRHELNVQVDVLPILDPQGQPWSGTATPRCGVTLDLNERGLLCARVGYLPVGGVVRLFIRLPTRPEAPIACNARVVRCEMSTVPAYGVKYLGLSHEDQTLIQRYARTRQAIAPSWYYRFAAD